MGSCGGGRQRHEGHGLEVPGGEIGRQTPLRSMGAVAWEPTCVVEKEMVSMGIELGAIFCYLFYLFIFCAIFLSMRLSPRNGARVLS